MLILPAIDLIGGRCVRLQQGDYERETTYDPDPLAVAQRFQEQGAEWLHIVDLDGAKQGHPVNSEVVKRIVEETDLKIEIGGGIRDLPAAEQAFAYGASRIIVGTKVVTDSALAEQFFSEFGERVVAGLDAKNRYLAVGGWLETSSMEILEVARRVESQGARRLIVTDIARDGMLAGPNLELLQDVLGAVSIPVIQSGGVTTLLDVETLGTLGPRPCEGVIIGKAIYEGRIDLEEAIKSANRPRLIPRSELQ